MAIDLSGLKVGTVWRVRTSYGDGLLLVRDTRPRRYTVQYDGDRGFDNYAASGLSVGGAFRIEQILHELKPVADITASDLDGRIIETSDGGKVLFADDSAVVWSKECRSGWTWGHKPEPRWADVCPRNDAVACQKAYAAELERRNPPVEIVWQDVLRIGDVIAQAHCTVRGDIWRISHTDIWRISHTEQGGYRIHCGLEYMAIRSGHTKAEQYIRDHYKDRAAEPA